MPFIAYANLWELPSLVVPVGEDENNMPVGIQIVSKVGNENAIFQLGEIIEKVSLALGVRYLTLSNLFCKNHLNLLNY